MEPLRARLYPILVAIIGLLVAYGVVDELQAPLWIALVAAVAGTVGVESARSKVTPVSGE